MKRGILDLLGSGGRGLEFGWRSVGGLKGGEELGATILGSEGSEKRVLVLSRGGSFFLLYSKGRDHFLPVVL